MKKFNLVLVSMLCFFATKSINESNLPEVEGSACCPRTRAVVAKSVLAPLARVVFFTASSAALIAKLPGTPVSVITADRAAEALCEATKEMPAVLLVPSLAGLTVGTYFLDKEMEQSCGFSFGCSTMFGNATVRSLYNATERANKGSIYSRFGKWLTGKMTPKRCQHTKPAPLLPSDNFNDIKSAHEIMLSTPLQTYGQQSTLYDPLMQSSASGSPSSYDYSERDSV